MQETQITSLRLQHACSHVWSGIQWNPRFTRRIVFLEKLSRSQQWFNATEKVTLQHKLELWASKASSLKEASHHQTCSNRPTDKTRLKWRLIWSRLHLFTLFNWHQYTVKNCLITTTKPEVLPRIIFWHVLQLFVIHNTHLSVHLHTRNPDVKSSSMLRCDFVMTLKRVRMGAPGLNLPNLIQT